MDSETPQPQPPVPPPAASDNRHEQGQAQQQLQQQQQDTSTDEEGGGGADDGDCIENLVSKAQGLMEKITSSQDDPSPIDLHALSSILETQESRYMEVSGHSSLNNGRASHNIGRLGNLIREYDEFFDLISSKFISETRYSISVHAAAARLLLSCSLTWMYPLVFEDTVVEKIKNWVMDETVCLGNYCNLKCDSGGVNLFDFEMLRTYSTGLFALCLAGGGPAVEDALTSGLSAKFMRYLRSCVFGESGPNQLGTSYLVDKNKLGVSSLGDKDGRMRIQNVLEATDVDGSRMLTEDSVADRSFERNREKKTDVGLDVRVDAYDVDGGGEDKWHGQELDGGKINLGDFDENLWIDSRRRATQGLVRSKGKRHVTEAVKETELALNIPGSGCLLFHGQITKDKSLPNNPDAKEIPDATCSGRSNAERNNNDDLFQEFKVGTMDISNSIKEAVLAAEAEARAANAPVEAIKAAGDAAAELVKSAALEEFQTSKDEETVLLAASRAASTVIDAAADIAVSRSSSGIIADSANSKSMEPEMNAVEDYFLPDRDSLAQLRQKYCIQCLEILGEYVEVLGPVLHEKGVDVCLALLQETSKPHETLKVEMILPDVLKLICALANHRKFAALFVDRGGIQKLLTIPRVLHTFFGLSSCLYTIGSLQGIMERVCALPSDVVHQVVKLALQLLECSQDQARKNAALFFAAAFVFRAVIDSFDSQNGLKKLLDLLHDAASVRSGVTSGALSLSASGSHRDRSPAEVLTASEKLIAYHTCVALRQYFRAHLILVVDSIRPSKNSRSAFRNIPCVKAAYKPLDISNEALDAVFLQLQKDRKLGPAFVRARWPAVDNFLASNGHSTMLELCQAPPVERYLRDLLQYALGVLHIVTLVPHSRKLLVSCTLSNDRVGIAVILDAANSAGCVDPDIIQPALNVLVNLVCPPPSISNKPPLPQGQKSVTGQTSNVRAGETRERNAERTIPERVVSVSAQSDSLERNGESSSADRGSTVVLGQSSVSTVSQTHVPTVTSGLVGDRRISLGVGAGSAGLAAQLEQGYRQAREAVRANNGIKVLLHLLQPRIVSPPATLDCLRALACRVLLGLARDDTIAHILTKLQVGKRLSELIRDSGNQTPGNEQGRWQSELAQVAIELIAIVTNTGRASRLAATDAATPALRRIERAAIAAATPITYHSRELLLLIHEHLQASGLAATAAALLEEAQLTPLPSLAAPLSLAHHASVQENPTSQLHWPSGRSPCGFFSNKLKLTLQNNDSNVMKCDSDLSSSWKKPLLFSSSLNLNSKNQSQSLEFHTPIISKVLSSNKSFMPLFPEVSSASLLKPNVDIESQCKTPILLPMKRKSTETKDAGFTSSGKRLNTGEHVFRSPGCLVPSVVRKGTIAGDANGFCSPMPREQCGRSMPGSVLADSLDDNQYGASATHACQLTPSSQLGLQNELYSSNTERLTLDSLVVQYLKHQHRQCTAPITTLPPLSLLHPHICPEPRRSLDAPSNVTSRLSAREFRGIYGGRQGNRRDRQFVYSRFRPWRTCRDVAVLLTCLTFLGNSSHIAAGSHSGELKIFDSDSSEVLESCTNHQSPLTLVQSCLVGETQLVLSSSSHDVRLWDASLISSGPLHSFQGCKSARFSNSGNIFAALPFDQAHREIFLYDIQTCNLESKLSDTSPSSSGLESGGANSLVHFSPSDIMLLWNGVLWDRRSSGPVHRFDQFTDFGGGGFHPAGNEVIINSEVWDLRKFRLLRSVPSLDQTNITFNARGDVLYAILRRNLEDITSAVHTRRAKHTLFSAFRTVDAVNYSDIATTPVDRCVLDFTNDSTDSFVGLVTMDDQEEMFSSARVYEIGRRRPTDDDSDPDDAESEEGDEEDDEDSVGDPILGPGFGGDGDSDDVDDMSNDDDSLSDPDDDEDDEDEGGGRILELLDESDDDSGLAESFSSGDEDEFAGAGFTF